MKKMPYALRLYLSFFLVAVSIVLTIVLNHTNSLLQDPKTTGEDFLSSMPYVQWGDFILIQPSSTFFVYFLGLVLIVLGCYLIQTAKGNKSRLDYGIGYALWGVSAILAGTSYQAFGYELKYAGRPYGLFTSVFELLYMITTAEAILYLLAGTSYYATTNPKIQKALPYVAIAYGLIYGIVFLIGVALPIQTIVTYLFFVAFFAPAFILMLILNIARFAHQKDVLDRNMLISWGLFALANILYFIAYFSGFPTAIYKASGFWFNENDILHVSMTVWVIATFFLLRKELKDNNETLARSV
jgi:hypothetical protein